ncbi:MAG: winged helix-turn-helix domain-containing protein, partial [Kiloniellales bacterium]|nr:winged helix-turn-helix domain-containing protein [Kiloniellales bacterium]
KEIHLGPIEYKLLQHLLQAPEQVFSREDLISAAWPDNVYVRLRTVDIHVGRLRKALKSVDKRDLIRTVRSAGYALAGPKGGNSTNAK